jgi:hypothetical protein
LTSAQLEEMRKKLSGQGTKLVGDEGDISKFGVTLHFTYVEPTLNIDVTHKPFYIKDETVSNTVNNWFKTEETI